MTQIAQTALAADEKAPALPQEEAPVEESAEVTEEETIDILTRLAGDDAKKISDWYSENKDTTMGRHVTDVASVAAKLSEFLTIEEADSMIPFEAGEKASSEPPGYRIALLSRLPKQSKYTIGVFDIKGPIMKNGKMKRTHCCVSTEFLRFVNTM